MKKIPQTQSVSSLPAQAGRPPVVAVLGHVDHGKTTLLDTIRKASVASREHGGITQHVGAYQIAISNIKNQILNSKTGKPELDTGNQHIKQYQEKPRLITFIDTPGHVAFDKMRSRGAQVADIALLVVAADDSVKPQTIESIEQIKAAGIPMIVAINKIDLPGAHIEKVKADLAKVGVQVEGFGGDVPFALLSAKQGKGVRELLDLILLVSDMKGLTSEPDAKLEAVVVETKIDKGRGMVATLLVKKGTLTQGADMFEGARLVGRVRAIFNEYGKRLDAVPPGTPAEVLGFSLLPPVGEILRKKPVTSEAKAAVVQAPKDLDQFMADMDEAAKKKLKILLKADTTGSLEAIIGSLPKEVTIVRKDLGDITEADILDAKSSKALVVGFNVKIGPNIEMLARTEKVIYRTYAIIYELLKEIADVVEGLEVVLAPERELGKGQIIAEFPYEGARIAGTKVVSGRLARGDTVKLMRQDSEVGRAKIKSMRIAKEEVNKVEEGFDCGILLDKKLDFALSDAIIAVTTG